VHGGESMGLKYIAWVANSALEESSEWRRVKVEAKLGVPTKRRNQRTGIKASPKTLRLT
jgi:hypothetical protein